MINFNRISKFILMKKFYSFLCCYFLFIQFSQSLFAQPIISYNAVITGLNQPVDVVSADDGSNRIFVVEQGGVIKVFSSTYAALGTFLTVTGISTGGEQGLLSLAFHPNYETNGFFWVYYTNSNGDLEVARYKVSTGNANLADAASKQVVITIPHPGQTNHNGAKINFGRDSYLYFATGDGGGSGDPANNAQNGNSLLGKMIRINARTSTSGPFYTIPSDNPFVTNPNVADEIWALGLRNPFRWSFDRANGNMWIGDVGQGQKEEINYRTAAQSAGVNYGWRCYEGSLAFNTAGCLAQSNYVFPVYEYDNLSGTNTPASVVGGYVYRGSAYPAMSGYYYATDVYSGNLYKINISNFSASVQTGLPTLVAGFGETESGELLATSLNGTVYALVPATPTSIDDLNDAQKPRLYPTVVTQKRFTLELPEAYTELQIINVNGVVLKQQTIRGLSGAVQISLDQIPSGIYIVRLLHPKKVWTTKVIIK
jgi:glucose/arabinose dehydrogenase